MGFRKWLGLYSAREQEQERRSICPEMIEEMKEEASGKYYVRNAGHLFWLAGMVNEKGHNFQCKTIVLAEDIDVRDYWWEPIGRSVKNAFCGVFDGNGHSIRGIRVDSDSAYAGFFGVVTGVNKLVIAEVYHLCLEDVRIKGRGEWTCAGGLIGYAQEGVRVEKCFVAGSIESVYCAGGIVGCAEDCVSVRNSECRGKVKGNDITGAWVGRLVTNSTILNCRNYMNDLSGRPEERPVGATDLTSLVK